MEAPSSGQGPEFEPRRRVLRAAANAFEEIAGALRSVSELWDALSEAGITTWKLTVVLISGVTGVTLVPVTVILDLPLHAMGPICGALQVPWVYLAVRSTKSDSDRRRLLHRLRVEQAEGLAQQLKVKEWRRQLAASMDGATVSLEKNAAVGEVMSQAIERFHEEIGCRLGLALVERKQGGRHVVERTSGDMSDCLKEGTAWNGRETDVHEYVENKSLYPHKEIDHQTLGQSEYYLVAIADIDLIGGARQIVLDVFYEMVAAEVSERVSSPSPGQGSEVPA